LTLVVDANAVVPSCTLDGGFTRFRGERLVAPPLLWPETRSVLHRSVWHGLVSPETGLRALARLETAPVESHDPQGLGREAWRIADELGWAKTYDAEYLALASLLGCGLATLDRRLRTAAQRLGIETPALG
jgi:predicted nucleic acid-binding protein